MDYPIFGQQTQSLYVSYLYRPRLWTRIPIMHAMVTRYFDNKRNRCMFLNSIVREYLLSSVHIVMSSGICPSGSTQKLCLENVVKLYLKVRSFSYAKDYVTKYKIKEKQVNKRALRKDMKQSSAEKTI